MWGLLRLAGLVVVALLVLTGCGGDDAAEPEPAPDPLEQPEQREEEPQEEVDQPEEEAEEPDAPELEFSRIQGVTTAEAYAEFGNEGLGRWQQQVPRIEDVRIPSSADDNVQPALWLPPQEEGRPLLVTVHSWSTPYLQHLQIPFAQWADEHDWALVNPNFRGVNDRPEATGSDLTVQDIIDAVDFAVDEGAIDDERVFIVGFSGGGMTALLMAARHPDRFAGAVAWVPVYDLQHWFDHNRRNQPERAYVDHIVASCGGDPTADEQAQQECRHRSPSAHLDDAREAGIPIYIGHGLDDPNVPPDHSFRAFNDLADEDDRFGGDVLRAVTQNRLPDDLQGSVEAETYFGEPDPEVFFARRSGPVTLVVFEGEHDMVYNPGLEWMVDVANQQS